MLQTSLQHIFDQFGWLGVVVVMAFENATGLSPSEIILGLAGWFLLSAHGLPFSAVFLGGFYAAIGSTLGASLTYWLARLGGRPLINRLAAWLHLPLAPVDWAEQQFNRWGPGLVFFGRLMPGIRSLVTIPAGMSRMPFLTFALATFGGTYIWCTVFLAIGYSLGHEWEHILVLVKTYSTVLLVTAALAGAAGLVYAWKTRLWLRWEWVRIKK